MRGMLQKLASSVSAKSLASSLRRKRFILFRALTSTNEPSTILDVGGSERFWEIQNFCNTIHKIIILNLTKFETHYPNIASVIGDARDLSMFDDQSIDIVFSNSVIEHLETHEHQTKMANEIRRVGRRYFIQTHSYYFLLEPHFLFPFFHWLPIAIRVLLVRYLSLGWYPKFKSKDEAYQAVTKIRLLRKSEVKALFPDSIIYSEKFCGFTKSYSAIRS
ncbi:MAG: class I SAM-dependent methyltransferase [Bacteroidetes bacterium]|nr:class I SAM-dependent methyltransferase [Bacteroidota bacterium]